MKLHAGRLDQAIQRAVPGIAILYAAIVGNLSIAVSPMIWGGFSQYLRFPDERIGQIMSGEFFGNAAATLAGIFYMHRDNLDLRLVTYTAIGVYVVGNCLTPMLFGYTPWLIGVRVICGLSAGTSYLAAATAIARLNSPRRLVALFYGAPFIAGAVLQPLMHPVFEHWGLARAFYLMAATTATAVVVYAFFPRFADERMEAPGEIRSASRSLASIGIIALALFLQYMANTGIWLFFERIGRLSGHTAQTVANIVGLGTGMALAGTWLSALLVKKLSAVNGILWGTGIITLSSITLHFSSHLVVYAGSVVAFNAMITFLTPFYFILLVETYSPAKAVVVGNICLTLGYTAGPLLIGYTVHGTDFTGAINVTVTLFVISAALVALFRVMHHSGPR